ncbi:MAG: tRNA preQ1(34) S-adenosylmethionine ribosyltransferase-isomerase QueA [Deltaproteobacteria bacterium]|nr:tRNA preQ1(34) S-adenosylmethionine ribosyltransferase-isomerase QueA [Deltaproteobacteria bacterium]
MDLADYDYELPPERIAQAPLAERDASRLLVLDRKTGARAHRHVRELPALLGPNDLLVLNATRVLPARLRGEKAGGGRAEALLLGAAQEAGAFEALVRARGRLRVGQKLRFARAAASADAEIAELSGDGRVVLRFAAGTDPYALGEMPLPPYIKRASENADDVARYQTVFARAPGSVAAPTAGLHFSDALLAALRARGVRTAEVVLHVGIGTFRPLREEDLAAGELHSERFELGEETVRAIRETRGRGGRVVAVGTTSTRVLESCADGRGGVIARAGETRLLLAPGAQFRVVDALLTNFHLPRSSLLLLVAAFAGREPVLAAYREAVALGYRFYSYGDAMLLS